jgi:hypothetical protein
MVEHRLRDQDCTGLGKRFQPRGDVNPLAIEIAALNDDIPKTPTRSWMRRPSAEPAPVIAFCRSIAQATAFTALANSTNAESPICLKMRP